MKKLTTDLSFSIILMVSTLILLVFSPTPEYKYRIPPQYIYWLILVTISFIQIVVLNRPFLAIFKYGPFKLFIVILVSILGMNIFSDNSEYCLRYLAIFSSLSICVYFIGYNLSPKYHNLLIIMFIGIVSIYSIFALILPINGGNINIHGIEFGQRSYKYMSIKRLSSLTQSPNMLGTLIMMSVPFLLWRLSISKSWYSLIVNFLLLILNSYVLYRTYSRSAMVGSIFCLFSYLIIFLLIKKMNLKYVLTIILIFIPILFYSFSNYDYKKDISFNERYSVKELSDMSGRMAIWESLKTYISKNLITGVGFGNSEKVLYEITDGRNSSTHNLYMGILLESGVIILGLISVLVFTILFDSFKTIIHSLEDKALESGAILSLILGLLVQEMGEFMLIRIHAVNFILILFISFLSKLSTQKNISKAFL